VKIEQFDYNLPRELIAQMPLKRRDQSRLLIIERKTGKITHARFKDFCGFVKPEDLLVLNDTKVRPVRLIGEVRERPVDILLAERLNKNLYLVKANPGKKLKPGAEIFFEDGKFSAVCREDETARQRGMKMIEFKLESDIEELLDDIGIMPLPPYIKRLSTKIDAQSYQTVYARNPGAIAAPTAGLHFTHEVFKELSEKGIESVFLTLHVGLGTFSAIKADDVRNHEMHEEFFELPVEAAGKIENVKQNKGKICAVGTTVCRVLEACA